MRRSALTKFSTVVSVVAAFALAPTGALAATIAAPPECSAPGAWTSISGALSSGEMTRMFLPSSKTTRACLTVPDGADFSLYLTAPRTALPRGSSSTTPRRCPSTNGSTPTRYADGKLWAFRLRIVRINGAGTYKLNWLGL